MRLTEEQQAVPETLANCSRVKVYALAGTGKTATLRASAERFPKKRILYLAFNKAIADEAKGKFPTNVEVRTVHSLAYVHVGRLYKSRLTALDFLEIAEALTEPPDAVIDQLKYFHSWMHSECLLDRRAIEGHLSSMYPKIEDPEQTAAFIIRLYKTLKEGSLQVDHSFYLKDFQLAFHTLGLTSAYDLVMLDEAQDTNPVILDVFEKFQAEKIMVGDRHQKVYGFRRAIDAMERFEAEATLHMTRTFRFDQADQVTAVNDLLYHLKCEDYSHLIKPGKIGGNGSSRTSCVITRTNAKLLEALAEWDLKTVRPPHQYFQRFFRIFARKIRVPEYDGTFKGYLGALESLAESVEDTDLAAAVKLIRQHRCQRKFFQELYDRASENYRVGGRELVGTAHSVKGLEFDMVELTDDFLGPDKLLSKLFQGQLESGSMVHLTRPRLRQVFRGLQDGMLKEEINLLYVALTRAREEVHFPRNYRVASEYHVEITGEKQG
ncbi:MAG: UvrD-helicase domain-containing protein [Thermodesulfobacteriota bacterium]